VTAELAEPGWPTVTGPVSRALRPPTYRRFQFLEVAVFVAVVALIAPQIISSDANRNLLDLWLAYCIAAVGFYWVFGLAGRFTFCQTFMMLLGAYMSAWITRQLSPKWFLFGLFCSVVVTAFAALLIGAATARARDFYFAIGTLAVTEVGMVIFPLVTKFTGPGGETIGVAPPQIGSHVLISEIDIFWLSLVLLTVVLLVAVLIERSPVAREAIASRDNAVVAKTLGIPLTRVQLELFMLGSAAGGLSGALIGHSTGTVTTGSFSINLAIGIFLMLLLGGANSMWGPVLGAAFYVYAPHLLQKFQNYETMIYGGLLLVIVIALPEGLIGVGQRAYARLGGRPAGAARGLLDRFNLDLGGRK
jgi:branched-chain amino acid transport system permease protein